jgi:hypothetical protein
VKISLKIERISRVSEKSMDYDISVFLKTEWRDSRFAQGNIVVGF